VAESGLAKYTGGFKGPENVVCMLPTSLPDEVNADMGRACTAS
jgi:hypothetical protein